MNQSRAKKIRKKIYANLSKRDKKYNIIRRVKNLFIKNAEGVTEKKERVTGQIVCIGLRREYLDAKRNYLKNGIMS